MPRRVLHSAYSNRLGSFADLLAQIAFLFTLPAPPFNTELTVQLGEPGEM